MNSIGFVSSAIISTHTNLKLASFSKPKIKIKTIPYSLNSSFRLSKLRVSATKDQNHSESQTSNNVSDDEVTEQHPLDENGGVGGGFDLGWLPAFPHVLIASLSNFTFGYHIGIMNGPIISIARELGFEGNSFIEGLVVSIFIAGAFIGSLSTGSLVDKLGCRLTFQIDTIPLILGAIISANAHSLDEILGGRFLVGLGIGVNAVLVPIYISEVFIDININFVINSYSAIIIG